MSDISMIESMIGLTIADSFGESIDSMRSKADDYIVARNLPDSIWEYTDDTIFAMSIVSNLLQYGHIEQDVLIDDIRTRYDYKRDYGHGMHALISRLNKGELWTDVSPSLFGGKGSYGNGACMRISPLGAYFEDIETVKIQTKLATEVTHAHPEAYAGAVTIAIASHLFYKNRNKDIDETSLLENILVEVPKSVVKKKLMRIFEIPLDTDVIEASRLLGDMRSESAQQTTPFTIWCALRHYDNYEEAIWSAMSVGGDRDTICAIVGGIVSSYTGIEGIPGNWIMSVEKIDNSIFERLGL